MSEAVWYNLNFLKNLFKKYDLCVSAELETSTGAASNTQMLRKLNSDLMSLISNLQSSERPHIYPTILFLKIKIHPAAQILLISGHNEQSEVLWLPLVSALLITVPAGSIQQPTAAAPFLLLVLLFVLFLLSFLILSSCCFHFLYSTLSYFVLPSFSLSVPLFLLYTL